MNDMGCWIALLALAGATAWGLGVLWRVVGIGAAHKAKVLSTALFTCEREIDPRHADEVAADSYRFMRMFGARIDRTSRTVTTSFLGIRPQTAIWRPGLGSTLTAGHAVAPRTLERSTISPSPWPVRPTTDRLAAAIAQPFAEPDPAKRRRTRAVIVVRGGEIAAERYAAGFDADSLFPGWSVAKSVVPALLGILVGEGRLGMDDCELRPEWRFPDLRAAISIEDLLRMRSGLKFREVYTNPWSDVLPMLYCQPDAAAYAAAQPLIARPGTRWNYSSGSTNILAAIIRRTLGDEGYLDWPRQALFDRIGMTSALLETDAAGTWVCSSYMLATARDWARFGELHLRNGIWNGERILPDGWVRFCTTPTPQSPNGNYGAHWWLKLQPEIGGTSAAAARIPADAFFAIGHEGQTLTVIPSLDLVIVRTGLSIYIDGWNQAEFVADIVAAL